MIRPAHSHLSTSNENNYSVKTLGIIYQMRYPVEHLRKRMVSYAQWEGRIPQFGNYLTTCLRYTFSFALNNRRRRRIYLFRFGTESRFSSNYHSPTSFFRRASSVRNPSLADCRSLELQFLERTNLFGDKRTNVWYKYRRRATV